tara:strand:+ start:327 stop:635 length:309 start_codon:yes stop_codon:yes gene_type:complete
MVFENFPEAHRLQGWLPCCSLNNPSAHPWHASVVCEKKPALHWQSDLFPKTFADVEKDRHGSHEVLPWAENSNGSQAWQLSREEEGETVENVPTWQGWHFLS